MSFKHKTALVTGGCGGLGEAIAQRFLAEGGNVVVCDVNKDLVDEFKKNISSAYPKCTLVKQCDVTDEKALDELFKEAEDTFGKLDAVINNAGIMDNVEPVGDLETALWDRVMAVNVTAPMYISKRAVNHFISKKTKGAIVNISSAAGFRGFSSGAAYTASKHALVGLTKNTAAFYGVNGPSKHGIRCNVICAGGMVTNMFKDALANGNVSEEGVSVQMMTWSEARLVLCDVGKMAKLVLYLCTDDAEMVNGAVWTADNGWSAY